MKKLCGGVVSFLLACGISWAGPVTVYDVDVTPDSTNKKVTVTYRLAESNASVANVSMNISSNAGESWTVPANTYYPGSDIGPGIPANGTLRQLIWDARSDWNQQYSTQMIIRLNATAAESQNGLFFTAGDKVYRMNLDGSAFTTVCSGLPKVEHLAVDYASSKLMINTWYSGSSILAYDMLRGGEASLLYNGPGIDGAQGFAYDPAASSIFMGLYYNGVYKMNLQSSTGRWQRIVSSDALSPMYGGHGQMALDPARQHIYFRSTYNGNCGECRWIWRVNYDGTDLTRIITANAGVALAIDTDAGHLYYSDVPEGGILKRANLDGSGVQTILTPPAKYSTCWMVALDVPSNKLYMYLVSTNWRDRAIARADLDGSNFEILKEVTDIADGWGFTLYIP